MITNTNIICIIADDLTGANDTGLQFKKNGADTNILLDRNVEQIQEHIPQVWALSTESRNVSASLAFEKVKQATEFFIEKINPDYFYKKIDSTVRGNIAVEVMSMINVLGWDCAVIIPSFAQEGRITVGGYQLLNSIPIEQTEMARDPHSPITESHLPTLLKNQLGENFEDLIGVIELKTVLDGAGPILKTLNQLISDGKKIIITDSTSQTDIEQIILAIRKTEYKILPVGNASAAIVLSNEWFPKKNNAQNDNVIKLKKLPKLIISGSATQITANQIKVLEKNCIYSPKSKIFELDIPTILSDNNQEFVSKIVQSLHEKDVVVVHTSNLFENFNGFDNDELKSDLTKAEFANIITDYLAKLCANILEQTQAILITLGGETSYKCCDAINANKLKLIDEVLPAIALSITENNQYIVTKSGNLGKDTTLIDILRYFELHEE